MKTLSATDKDFICDIQAPCFQSLSPEEMEIIQESRTQVLFRKGENLTKQGAFAYCSSDNYFIRVTLSPVAVYSN